MSRVFVAGLIAIALLFLGSVAFLSWTVRSSGPPAAAPAPPRVETGSPTAGPAGGGDGGLLRPRLSRPVRSHAARRTSCPLEAPRARYVPARDHRRPLRTPGPRRAVRASRRSVAPGSRPLADVVHALRGESRAGYASSRRSPSRPLRRTRPRWPARESCSAATPSPPRAPSREAMAAAVLTEIFDLSGRRTDRPEPPTRGRSLPRTKRTSRREFPDRASLTVAGLASGGSALAQMGGGGMGGGGMGGGTGVVDPPVSGPLLDLPSPAARW